ncbi:MAG: hypothetical protein Q9187_002035 [Circinaria calcarea]
MMVMTTQKMEPHVGDRLVNFEGKAVIHTELQSGSSSRIEEAQVMSPKSVTDESQSKMRAQWNSVMCKAMEVPQGYQNVAVLIVKWTEQLDELKSADEVKELDELLRQNFNYSTEIFEIDITTSPKLQLKKAVLDFVYKYNGRHNLLIVYYTGHGWYNEVTRQYEFHASSTEPIRRDNIYKASASWTNAEKPLTEDAEGDVLFIADACFASNIIKAPQQDDSRVYELLCASTLNKPTEGPGPRSFTTALISSLKKLLGESGDIPFVTSQLCEEINLHPERSQRPCGFWRYNHQYHRSIEWAPLKRTLDERKKDFSHDEARAFLDLRFSLTIDCLNENQINTLSEALCNAAKKSKAPVRSIDWQRLHYPQRDTVFADAGIALAYAKRSGKRWRQAQTSRKRKNIEGQLEPSNPRSRHRSPEDNRQREHTTLGAYPLTPLS